jgi:hypothetical protein
VANISAATTNGVCLVDGYVKFGTADGTFKLQHAANGTGTSTIKANSWLAVQRLP